MSFRLCDRSDIWQAPRQLCRRACQISKRCDNSNYQSRGFEAYLTIRRLICYLNGIIFLNENVLIAIKISMKLVSKSQIKNIPALVQIMVWRRPGDKPLSKQVMIFPLTHICVTQPHYFKKRCEYLSHYSRGSHTSLTISYLISKQARYIIISDHTLPAIMNEKETSAVIAEVNNSIRSKFNLWSLHRGPGPLLVT